MRVAVGGIWQETNTFVPSATTLEDFRRYQLFEGGELLDALRGTGSELGGASDVADPAGITLVPLLFGAALPSGTVQRAAFETMLNRLVERLRSAPTVDAVVLAVHGAMVVDGYDDPESTLVRAVREVVADIPIAVTLDYHANLGPDLPHVADYLVGYRTYPHTDMADRGADAMELAVRAARTGRRDQAAMVKLPLLTVPVAQEGAAEPMASILREVDGLIGRSGVATASALPGFAYGDGRRLGFAVYVAATKGAHALAGELAGWVWSRREQFVFDLVDPAVAARSVRSGPAPVVLVDVADNVGGGSPGNGTAILHALARQGIRTAVTVFWDPVAVAAAQTHPSSFGSFEIGSRDDSSMGPMFVASGAIRRCGRVVYRRTGSYMRGQQVDMGEVVVIESSVGPIVLTQNRVVPFDDDHLRVLGIEPRTAGAIVAKGAIAWKAAFGDYAGRTVYVRTPGYTPSALDQLHYTSRPERLFPLERDPVWEQQVAGQW